MNFNILKKLLGSNKSYNMPLIKNTLVFLDTGFFKNFKAGDKYDPDFLEYSREGKITLCTSYICLEEWRSQKTNHLNNYLRSKKKEYSSHRGSNPIGDGILNSYPLRHPDQDEIDKKSQEIVNTFVDDYKIIKYMPTEKHITRTWQAYFRGLAPFKRSKNKDDIPDSWIFEAARDARFDEEHKALKNRFCIGGDTNLNSNFEKLGLTPIKVIDLLKLLHQDEERASKGIESEAPSPPTAPEASLSSGEIGEISETDSLNNILNTAINADMKEIYLRLLGYTHWLSNPEKTKLFSLIENRGFDLELIKASATILTQESLKLLQDTDNYFLPINKIICEEAATRIQDEIIELLGQD